MSVNYRVSSHNIYCYPVYTIHKLVTVYKYHSYRSGQFIAGIMHAHTHGHTHAHTRIHTYLKVWSLCSHSTVVLHSECSRDNELHTSAATQSSTTDKLHSVNNALYSRKFHRSGIAFSQEKMFVNFSENAIQENYLLYGITSWEGNYTHTLYLARRLVAMATKLASSMLEAYLLLRK